MDTLPWHALHLLAEYPAIAPETQSSEFQVSVFQE